MSRFTVGLALLATLFAAASPSIARAAEKAEIISRGKAATALVEFATENNKISGSAFCIDGEEGFFVTSKHLFNRNNRRFPGRMAPTTFPGETASAYSAENQTVTLILNAGETNQKSVTAKVIRSSPTGDLAILRATDCKGTPKLDLGAAESLIETAPVTAFGYPFGAALAGRDEYPNITVSTGKITSFRRLKGELQYIQLDASLNPGNSGGPVIDEKGNVVGIVAAGISGSGVNFAIPVSQLAALLSKAEVECTPPAVAEANQYDLADFAVKVLTLGEKKPSLTVELTLTAGRATPRTFLATPDAQGIYHAKAAPLPRPQSVKDLKITAEFANGSISGIAADTTLKLPERSIKLSEIARLEPANNGGTIKLLDNSTLAGTPAGLEALTLSLGQVSLKIDLSKAASIRVDDLTESFNAVNYAVVVKEKGKDQVLGQATGVLAIAGAKAASPLAAIGLTPAKIKDKEVIKLPAAIDNVVAGANGRYLFLLMKKFNKIGVFDTTQGKIARYISIPSENVLMAAGSNKLILVLPDQSIIQRYDLATFERELAQPLPDEARNQNIAMGWASPGPLFCSNGKLIDVNTLKLIDTVADNNAAAHFENGMQLRASGDGSTFGLWRTNSSPNGIYVVNVNGNKIKWRYEHSSGGSIMPNYDGSLILTSIGILKPDSIQLISERGNRMSIGQIVPAYHPNYHLALKGPNINDYSDRAREAKPSLSIYTSDDQRLLVTLPDVDELAFTSPNYGFNFAGLTLDKRIHFIPSAEILVTVGEGLDNLVIRHLNILEAMQKADIDYLFVTSIPVRAAAKGARYSYQLQAAARKGGVTFKLDTGPDGMKLTGDRLDWNVPDDFAGTQAGVIISVRDAAGQEILHSFNINVK